jgi:hypothetical protein
MEKVPKGNVALWHNLPIHPYLLRDLGGLQVSFEHVNSRVLYFHYNLVLTAIVTSDAPYIF